MKFWILFLGLVCPSILLAAPFEDILSKNAKPLNDLEVQILAWSEQLPVFDVAEMDFEAYFSTQEWSPSERAQYILDFYFYNLLLQTPSQYTKVLRDVYFGKAFVTPRIYFESQLRDLGPVEVLGYTNLNQIHFSQGDLVLEEPLDVAHLPLLQKFFRLRAAHKAYVFLYWMKINPELKIDDFYHAVNLMGEALFVTLARRYFEELSDYDGLFYTEIVTEGSYLESAIDFQDYFVQPFRYSYEDFVIDQLASVPLILFNQSERLLTQFESWVMDADVYPVTAKDYEWAVLERYGAQYDMASIEKSRLEDLIQEEKLLGDSVMMQYLQISKQRGSSYSEIESRIKSGIGGNVVSFASCNQRLQKRPR